jgi:hypothetical protein
MADGKGPRAAQSAGHNVDLLWQGGSIENYVHAGTASLREQSAIHYLRRGRA